MYIRSSCCRLLDVTDLTVCDEFVSLDGPYTALTLDGWFVSFRFAAPSVGGTTRLANLRGKFSKTYKNRQQSLCQILRVVTIECDYILPVCIVPLTAMLSFLVGFVIHLVSGPRRSVLATTVLNVH